MPVVMALVVVALALGELRPIGEGLRDQSFDLGQFQHPPRRQRLHHVVHPGAQRLAGPDHQIGGCDGARLAGPQLRVMRIAAAIQKQLGRTQIAHHDGRQRMVDRHVHNNTRHLCQGRGGHQEQGKRGAKHGGHRGRGFNGVGMGYTGAVIV